MFYSRRQKSSDKRRLITLSIQELTVVSPELHLNSNCNIARNASSHKNPPSRRQGVVVVTKEVPIWYYYESNFSRMSELRKPVPIEQFE